ncbi:hypothetical protein BGZ59_002497, partial [Podila verticillata]
MAHILQKVEAAIEMDQVPIVISDWHLSAVWDKDLFSFDGISKHFDHFTQVGSNSSSLWFIASPKDYGKVKQLWDSWGKFFEQENYSATLEELMASEITFYKVDQKPGDLIILPPMATHQVYNK